MSWHNEYIKIPFQTRGRTDKGADCWGLFCIVFKKERNIELTDYSNLYDNIDDVQKLPEIINKESSKWENVNFGEEKPFDAVILRMRGLPMHVGIVVRKGFMLHCSENVGTTFESYDSLKWKNRVLGFCRYVK